MTERKYLNDAPILSDQRKNANLLPPDVVTVKQLSFASALKYKYVKLFKPIPKSINTFNYGSYKCPVVIWITVFFLIFAVFQALVSVFLFNEWSKQRNNINANCKNKNRNEITSSDETTTSNVNVFTATNNTLILGPTTSTIPTMYTTKPTTATQSTISTIIKTTNPPAVTTTDPTATTASTTSLMTTLLTNPSIATVTPTTSQTVATSSLTTNPTIRPTVSVNCANKDDFLICGYLTNNKGACSQPAVQFDCPVTCNC